MTHKEYSLLNKKEKEKIIKKWRKNPATVGEKGWISFSDFLKLETR